MLETPSLVDLREHAALVAAVLRAARALGPVAIVTLSERGWVPYSAAQFLPGLDFSALLQELDISIYYAREEDEALDDMEDWEGLKRCSMLRCVKTWQDLGVLSGALHSSLVSIGDSIIEQEALRSLAGPYFSIPGFTVRPALKALKLMDSPSLRELGSELQALQPLLPFFGGGDDRAIEILHPMQLDAQLFQCCEDMGPHSS